MRTGLTLKSIATAAAITLLASCSTVWIPLEKSPRAAVAKGEVQFLDSPPTRPHVVIGIITPPAGEYETEAEAVKAMRGIAAKQGADAIYIESQSESGGWRFGTGWRGAVSGGSFSELHFRAKAIVWKGASATIKSSASPAPPQSVASSPEQYPTARAVPGKPGYVFSPYDPAGGYVDVTGFASGSKVKDPYSGKIFLAP